VTLTPQQRSQHARLARLAGWAATEDWSAATAPARAAFLSRFEREVDPHGQLPPEDRGKRAEAARRAYFTRLALKSSRARAARKAGGDGTA
jgi:hypothetical protein